MRSAVAFIVIGVIGIGSAAADKQEKGEPTRKEATPAKGTAGAEKKQTAAMKAMENDPEVKAFAESMKQQLADFGVKLAEEIKKQLKPQVHEEVKKAVEQIQKNAAKQPAPETKPAAPEKKEEKKP
jgi:hypothetical protein